MNQFFKVKTLEEVLALKDAFSPLESESISVAESFSRIVAQDLVAKNDMPGFRRATMDGYAVAAQSTFGASESSPAWLEIKGSVAMGDIPDFVLEPGTAAKISTGGMLPRGADSVVMVEHTEQIDDASVEIYKSVAPLQHVIDSAEDYAKDAVAVSRGTRIRPQEQGLTAGLGINSLEVYKTPKIGIISTGDEIISINEPFVPGKIRDINSYSLAGFVREAQALPVCYGIIKDDPTAMETALKKALKETDMVLISGGSSVGTKDYTLDVLSGLPDTQILVHGISVSPGKPTILARSGTKPVWGLPGQVTSAMVVFKIAVVPFINHIQGKNQINPDITIRGRLTRNIPSAQGRRDFVRVVLKKENNQYQVFPVLGKSGLIKTMIDADGLLEIGDDTEGLEKDTLVDVILL